MSYVVLARKWRPTRFEDLVGQEHVARTLANAIASGRIAHAFLFTGVRGVGKTTSARLLARALNCMGNRSENEPDPGPTASPCLECAACREITQGSDVDVREIDGASYNGVDEVRKLQDSLPYRPTRDRYKIFIIDEVHMLSQSAWNAFLKTLEEPPPHVKFIFATTEVHKVPVTILSRVQRFDFKLIATRQIVDRLRFVLNAEGIATDDAGLAIIARQAAGSMRDAMSLLDQVIAWNDQKLDGESVARVLGVASRKILHELAAAVVDGQAGQCLEIVQRISQQGFDLAHASRDFLELLRDLVVMKHCTSPGELLDMPDEEQRDAQTLAGRANPDDLLRLYHGFSSGFDDVLRGVHPRSALEMLLLRLCRRPPLLPLDDLLSRLVSLERRLGQPSGGGLGPAPVPRRPNQPLAPPVDSSSTPARPRPREEHSTPAKRSAPEGDKDEPAGSLPSAAPPLSDALPLEASAPADAVAAASQPARVESAQLTTAPRPESPPPSAPVRPLSNPANTSPQSNASTGKPENPALSAPSHHRPAAPPPATSSRASTQPMSAPVQAASMRRSNAGIEGAPARSTTPLSMGSSSAPPEPEQADEAELMALWQELVERVMHVRPDVSAILEHALLIEAKGDRLVVAWPPDSVFAGQFDDALLIKLIRTAQRERNGSSVQVSILQGDPRARGKDTLASRETAERTRRYRQEQARIRNHPLVKDIQELLGGRVLSIKLADH